MKSRFDFTKASGSGNDFVIIDNRDGRMVAPRPELARTLCHRNNGIGADGLLVLEASSIADFLLEYYNADGSTGAMCGNGGRCAALFACARGIAGSQVRFEALGDLYEAEVTGDLVRLRMQNPSSIKKLPAIHVEGQVLDGFSVNTGAPHAVFFCDLLDEFDVERLGRAIRHSSLLAPEGANVDFVCVKGRSKIAVRTYERGVESETLACGTGAVASAIIAHAEQDVLPPVEVVVRSGETLRVYYDAVANSYSNVMLEGKAFLTYSGKVLYDSNSSIISAIF